MSNPSEDLEHRVNALHLVLVETLAHVGKADPEVLQHLSRLFAERADNVSSIRPDTLQYAAGLVREAQKVADAHG